MLNQTILRVTLFLDIQLLEILITNKRRDQSLFLIDSLNFVLDLSPINIHFQRLQQLIRKIQEYVMTYYYKDMGATPADS